MTIGLDIRTLMDKQYSGVSEYTFNLVKEILRLDEKNDYKLFYNSGRDVSANIPKFSGRYEIIAKRYPNKFFNYFLQKIFHYPKIDRLLGVDLFFMPHLNFIALSGGCRSALTVHDLSFLRHPEFFSFRKNFWHKMINVKKLIKNSDLIIAVSQNTKNDLTELLGAEPEKIKVIYSGLGPEFKPISDGEKLREVKLKYQLPEKFIFFLGTIEPRKNLDGLISAYNLLRLEPEFREVKLLMAGGRGWENKNIYQAREKSPFREDIKFLGYVPSADKPALYNSASLFVYPSFYEGFGFPPLEAMACGAPVIASSAASLPEVVGEAGLLADPYDIAGLALAMAKALTEEKLRENLRKKGLARAAEFSWEKTAGEYLEIIHSLRA